MTTKDPFSDYAKVGVYMCWIALMLEEQHGCDTTSKVAQIETLVKQHCPGLSPEMMGNLYRALLNSRKDVREFMEKASPVLIQAWQDGLFNINTGVALTVFPPESQAAIVDGLRSGRVKVDDVGAIAAFIHRLDGNEEPEPEEFITFSNDLARIVWGTADTYTGAEGGVEQSR